MTEQMDSPDLSKLGKVLQTASRFSKNAAMSVVQQSLLPHVFRVFSDHDHEEVRRMILVNYPLVEKRLSPNVKKALDNLGSNDELRQQWEHIVLTTVTPENVLDWLHNPRDYIDAELSDEHVAEMKYCAVVIEDTAGGEAWLERQILQLYRYANIIPDEPKPEAADD